MSVPDIFSEAELHTLCRSHAGLTTLLLRLAVDKYKTCLQNLFDLQQSMVNDHCSPEVGTMASSERAPHEGIRGSGKGAKVHAFCKGPG